MGLRGFVQQQVVNAFRQIGDLARPVTYKSLTGVVTRDLVAGTVTAASNNYTIARSVFAKFKEGENDKNVQHTTDEKLLFAAKDLPVTPKTADVIVDENNRTWEVVDRLGDPASALVVLHVRTSR